MRSRAASLTQVWLPFAAPCDSFVATNFPNLVAFGRRCTSAAPAGGTPPPPAAATGTTYYAEGTLTMSNANPVSTQAILRLLVMGRHISGNPLWLQAIRRSLWCTGLF